MSQEMKQEAFEKESLSVWHNRMFVAANFILSDSQTAI
jgi:hypothetical protein